MTLLAPQKMHESRFYAALFWSYRQLQLPQTITDFVRHLGHAHPLLHHEFAGKSGALRRSRTQVKTDAAILALFIPAETAVRDILRREVLHAAEKHVPFRDFKLFIAELDLDELVERAEQRPRTVHGMILVEKWFLTKMSYVKWSDVLKSGIAKTAEIAKIGN
jgi:hypothetical protein